jgi:peptidoglycan/LPS O-acetylase OafA/YrhL
MVSGAFGLGRFANEGGMGVQIFFLASGVTIFMSLDRAAGRERRPTLNFFIRRIFRVLPMLWVAIGLYCVVPGREVQTPPAHTGFPSMVLAALLQQGWNPRSINGIVPGIWALGAEANFYLVAPLCFLVVTGWRRALWLIPAALMLSYAAAVAVGRLRDSGAIFGDVPDPLFGFFLARWFFGQLPTFAMGIFTYHAMKSAPPGLLDRRTGLLFLLTGALLAAAFVSVGWRQLVTERTAFAFAFLLVLFGLRANPVGLLVNPVTRFLGGASYSIYLLHFAVLAVGAPWLGRVFPGLAASHGLFFAALWFGTALVASGAGWLATSLVERPLIRLGGRLIASLEMAPVTTGK